MRASRSLRNLGGEQGASSFNEVKLADGVYAFIDYDATREFAFVNSIVVIGDDGVLVFDSNQLPSLSRKV